jgi:hypothetical protein
MPSFNFNAPQEHISDQTFEAVTVNNSSSSNGISWFGIILSNAQENLIIVILNFLFFLVMTILFRVFHDNPFVLKLLRFFVSIKTLICTGGVPTEKDDENVEI